MHLCNRFSFALMILAFTVLVPSPVHAGKQTKSTATNPIVRMTTSLGVIELELDAAKAPDTVANFLKYIEDGFYNGTIFHRVIPDFMIQGGGLEPGMERKATRETITNEATNGLYNVTGSIAMARTSAPHSATSQFFINTVDNPSLDHTDKSARGWGYAVFGKVIKGMDVVKKIESVPTGRVAGYSDVPKKDVIIEKVEVVKP